MFQTDAVDVFASNVINLSLTEGYTKSVFGDTVSSVTSGSTMATGSGNNSYRHMQTTDLPTIDNINESTQSNIGFDEIMNNIHGIIYDDSDYVVISLYIPVFIMALTANTMVIIVVFKYHYMRNVTNFFLVNLSIADLLVTLVCMPVAVSRSVTYLWNYGFVLCKLAAYLQGVAVATSVFTITAMSIDRYLAITQPMGFPKLLNRKSATIVIMILWLISLIIFSPLLWVYITEELPIPPEDFFKTSNASSQLLYTNNNDTMNSSSSFVNNNSLYKQFPEFPDKKIVFCREFWSNDFPLQRNVFGYICFILVYAIPGSIMVVAYSLMGRTLCSVRPPFDINEGRSSTQQSFRLVRERKRVAWILLLLAVLFAACWLPNNMITLLIDINGVENAQVTRLHRFALLLGHTNSAINPLLYCFMTKNFRRSVKELVFNTRRRWTTHQRRRQRQCQASQNSSDPVNSSFQHQQRNGSSRKWQHQYAGGQGVNNGCHVCRSCTSKQQLQDQRHHHKCRREPPGQRQHNPSKNQQWLRLVPINSSKTPGHTKLQQHTDFIGNTDVVVKERQQLLFAKHPTNEFRGPKNCDSRDKTSGEFDGKGAQTESTVFNV